MKQPNKNKLKKAVKAGVLSGAKNVLKGFAKVEDATPDALKKPKRQWSVSASIPLGDKKKKKQQKKINKWERKQ